MDASNDAAQTCDTDTACSDQPFPFCLGWEGIIAGLPWLGWIGVTTCIAGALVPWWAAFPIGLILGTGIWFVTGVVNGGTTLIEMGIGSTIPLIMVAILMPVFAQARAKAREQICRTHLRQLGVALQRYAEDHDNSLPPADDWEKALEHYGDMTTQRTPFRCPESSQEHAYQFNPALGSLDLSALAGQEPLPLLWDEAPRHTLRDGGHVNVLFTDGSLQRVTVPQPLQKPAWRLGF